MWEVSGEINKSDMYLTPCAVISVKLKEVTNSSSQILKLYYEIFQKGDFMSIAYKLITFIFVNIKIKSETFTPHPTRKLEWTGCFICEMIGA